MPPRRETAVLLYDCSREAGKRKTGNRMGIELENLNSEQLKAATHFEGPLLILAGAGSGKTRVLTHRIAWLIEEKDVKPWNICAITFTNKAAGEMRERVNRMVGFGAEAINVSTFHSACVRILRRFIDRIGYGTNFVIYDSDDSKNVMKDVCRSLEIDTKVYKERMFLGRISSAKDELISPEQFLEMAQGDLQEELAGRVYAEYQSRLHRSNALDFDDLIGLTVELFRKAPDVLDYYQERFRYIMVDEYQDTNKAQFVFVSLLAHKYRNLCVVGDDDQSIYRFRGADIGNILNFEQIFPDAEVIRLEQNYRSTQKILDAANAVIANNSARKSKKLWTSNGAGDQLTFRRFHTAREEAVFITEDIARKKRKGICDYRESAVLYRTNAQSRVLEEQLLYENIPYTIIGGVNFYARKEIKDLLAYLKVIDNSKDDLAVKRIINIPKRGIGATSISRIDHYAVSHELSFYEACRTADKIPGIGRGGLKVRAFVDFTEQLKARADGEGPVNILKEVIEKTGYVEELRLEMTDEAADRIANIDELISKAAAYEDAVREAQADSADSQAADLQGFLAEVALVADIDSLEGDSDRVPLMTLHSAKGLEFENVYLAGMDQGIFPTYHAISSEDSSDLEEERRLCYVGITRAKRFLTLTSAQTRLLRGEMMWYKVSDFVDEIPEELLDDNRWTESGASDEGTGGSLGEKFGSLSDNVKAAAGSLSHKLTRAQAMKRKEHEEFSQKPFYLKASQTASSAAGKGKGNVAGLRTGADLRAGAALEYAEGDRVSHVKFGEGTVREIREGGRDKEVTVEFDNFGVKKMFAAFAKLKKLDR